MTEGFFILASGPIEVGIYSPHADLELDWVLLEHFDLYDDWKPFLTKEHAESRISSWMSDWPNEAGSMWVVTMKEMKDFIEMSKL